MQPCDASDLGELLAGTGVAATGAEINQGWEKPMAKRGKGKGSGKGRKGRGY
jgi:hypothetical protein